MKETTLKKKNAVLFPFLYFPLVFLLAFVFFLLSEQTVVTA
jgi:hypothetical protein